MVSRRTPASFRQSYVHLSVFSFPDINLSKRQWIFTKLGMCIDIVEIWFGFANGQIFVFFFTELSARYRTVAAYYSLMLLFLHIYLQQQTYNDKQWHNSFHYSLHFALTTFITWPKTILIYYLIIKLVNSQHNPDQECFSLK